MGVMPLSYPSSHRRSAQSEPAETRSSAELLAVVLGLRGEEGIARAAILLAGLEAGVGELDRLGVRLSPAQRLRLESALEVGRRVERASRAGRRRIQGPEDVVALMAPHLRKLPQEEFHVLLLNTRHDILGSRMVSRGILDASLVHPREVFAPALEARAASVVLVHNHPSGDPTPSPEDRRVTETLTEAGGILGIRVLDHLVIGDPGWCSVSTPRAMPRP
jgi:DNA repair protein RadC